MRGLILTGWIQARQLGKKPTPREEHSVWLPAQFLADWGRYFAEWAGAPAFLMRYVLTHLYLLLITDR